MRFISLANTGSRQATGAAATFMPSCQRDYRYDVVFSIF